MEQKEVLSNGSHYLSGIGFGSYYDEWNDEETEVNLFCIDGVTYGAYIDPVDGFRSYGHIGVYSKGECQYTFPPQEIVLENIEVDEEVRDADSCYWGEHIRKSFIVMRDAVNGKEVLSVGTDYTDDYYPTAIFNYSPENMYINEVVFKSNK